jgi:hypothetical protein
MTKVYGASDDLIEIEGDVYDEISHYDRVTRLNFSDGTALDVKYGKLNSKKEVIGVWNVDVIEEGSLFYYKTECLDEDADIYSDIVFFKDGIKYFSEVEQ